MNDSLLCSTIKQILEEKMSASAMDINVESKNANILLSGMVDVLSEKVYAEEIVHSINEVKKIENNITIATDGYIPDSDIEKYVQTRLKDSNITAISPKVEGGVVNLVGHAKDYYTVQEAIKLSQRTRGVKDVTSNIKIDTKEYIDNDRITSTITQILTNNGINTNTINAKVKSGAITLTGYAQNIKDIELAQELISKIEGVVKIKNHLKINHK